MGLPLTDAEILKFWKCEMPKKKSKGVPLKKKKVSWKTKIKSTRNCLEWRKKLKKSGQQIWPWNKSNIQTLFRAIFIIKKLIGAHQIEKKWYIYSKQHKIMLFKLKNNTGCRVCRCVFRRVCRRGSWHYLILMYAAASAEAPLDAAANLFSRKHQKTL